MMDFSKVTQWKIPQGDVVKVTDSQNRIIWQKGSSPSPSPDYTEPFYVENITNENETLSIVKSRSSAPTLAIEYSTDKSNWQTLGTTSTTALSMTVAPGERTYLRCNTSRWGDNNNNYYNRIQGVSKVGGNIMSLLYGSNFTGQETSFPSGSTYPYKWLFYENTSLVEASELLLPATTLADECYASMFRSCSALTSAPELPATTLAQSCYSSMFGGCTSLTSAPALPATTLVDRCYSWMFGGCTSLSSGTCLATSGINTNNSTVNWLNSVSSTGTFTKAAGSTWPEGASGIPSGWTVVEV